MCGRYTRYLSWSEIHRLYRLTAPAEGEGRNTEARYNIAPTQTVDFITWADDGNHKLREGRWGLIPFWAKDEKIGYSTFNARSEDAATKPSFRDAWKSKRCLIPADGFYEWTISPADGKKDPWHIFQPGHSPFSFAGLWAYNSGLDVTSCTIVTESAGKTMQQLHDRQPVILDPAYYDVWLDPKTPVDALHDVLSHDIDDQLQFHRVCRDVNATVTKDKQRNDAPHFIEPFPNPQ